MGEKSQGREGRSPPSFPPARDPVLLCCGDRAVVWLLWGRVLTAILWDMGMPLCPSNKLPYDAVCRVQFCSLQLESVWAAITKNTADQGADKPQTFISLSSGSWKSKIKWPAWPFSGDHPCHQ